MTAALLGAAMLLSPLTGARAESGSSTPIHHQQALGPQDWRPGKAGFGVKG